MIKVNLGAKGQPNVAFFGGAAQDVLAEAMTVCGAAWKYVLDRYGEDEAESFKTTMILMVADSSSAVWQADKMIAVDMDELRKQMEEADDGDV